jgi:hypothetical protein
VVVKIENVSNAVATVLHVDVAAVDTSGNVVTGGCPQANNTMPIDEVFGRSVQAALSGSLEGSNARVCGEEDGKRVNLVAASLRAVADNPVVNPCHLIGRERTVHESVLALGGSASVGNDRVGGNGLIVLRHVKNALERSNDVLHRRPVPHLPFRSSGRNRCKSPFVVQFAVLTLSGEKCPPLTHHLRVRVPVQPPTNAILEYLIDCHGSAGDETAQQ